MKAILALLILLMPALAFSATPLDVENVTIPYATKNSVSCGALQICELEFQAGETVNDFSLRDTQNWSINPAVTGEDAKKVHHLILMPVSAGLTTPLTVTTDRRIYEVMLESNGHIQKSRKIAFSYQAPSDKINDISKLPSFIKETPTEMKIPGSQIDSASAPILEQRKKLSQTEVSQVEVLPLDVTNEKKVWSIKKSDGSIFKALDRWAKEVKWQLQWETDKKDFPVMFEAAYPGKFEDAILGVVTSLQNSQYPLRACFYNNNAVRVIHKSKDCLDK